MNDRLNSFLLKISIIIFALYGVFMCAFLYPLIISLTSVGLMDVYPISVAQEIQFWTQLIFYWATSLPCFVVLILGWIISDLVKKSEIFTIKSAKLLKYCSIILFADIGVFLIGNCIFELLKWSDPLFPSYLFVSIMGIAVATIAGALSHYTLNAALLKEEAESIV